MHEGCSTGMCIRDYGEWGMRHGACSTASVLLCLLCGEESKMRLDWCSVDCHKQQNMDRGPHAQGEELCSAWVGSRAHVVSDFCYMMMQKTL
jgi:hypothetical protein